MPQKPIGPQPTFQPAVLYVPAEAGKPVVVLGAVLSTRRFATVVELVTLPAASVTTTRRS